MDMMRFVVIVILKIYLKGYVVLGLFRTIIMFIENLRLFVIGENGLVWI